MPGCPIRKSADLMLVCSSPQLIAAYHVLRRLLEPRHPPCALICFKTIQIFRSLTSLKVTRYYNFIPNMSKSYDLRLHRRSAFTRFPTTPTQSFADVPVSNRAIRLPFRARITSSCQKNCKQLPSPPSLRTLLLGFGSQAILRGANVFERPSVVRAGVEDIGVEPMTPCLQSRCSSQLS